MNRNSTSWKTLLKVAVVTSAFTATGLAQAVSGTLAVGGTRTELGWSVSNLQGSGSLTFSSSLLGALNAGGIELVEIAPAVLTTTTSPRGAYLTGSVAAPIQALDGDFDGSTLTITGVDTTGGATLKATADGFTNTGGSLTIQNIFVDVAAKKVFADIIGANGVGAKNNIELWSVATLTGKTSFPAVPGVTSSTNTLSGLTINATAYGYFSKALGLTDVGNTAMGSITDYGSMTSNISVFAAPVPEPSTYLMMGVGLMALAGVQAARQRKQ
ncbi:MAG: PEP-CTERM sorting domain-containing protein [Rubrivivax sp.]|nr:MAG: PEP-CTERM sorting domain-containing protein [Rubrivivax sp.]